MSGALTAGTVQLIWNSDDKHLYKVLQVIEVCSLGSGRTKLVLSDGEFYQQALLNLPPSDTVLNKLSEFCLVLITNYNVQIIDQGVKVIIITGLNYLDNPGHQIGEPRNFEASTRAPTAHITSHPVAPPPRQEVDRSAAEGYAPIKALSTMMTDWVIKARVVSKDNVKEWNNPRGSGKLFSCILMDVHGTEIQATFFKEGVDMHFDKIKEGNVYTFSNGQVKLARAQFNHTGNDYQLNFDGKSLVNLVTDDKRIGSLKFNIVPLDQLRNLPKNSIVDTCAVVLEFGELVELVSKKGDHLSKRVLKLIDQTRTSVELTLWGPAAQQDYAIDFAAPKRILLAKGLRTSDFNTISLTADKTSKLFFDDEGYDNTKAMKRWRDAELHKVTETVDLSVKNSNIGGGKRELKTINEIKAIWEGPSPPYEEGAYYVHGSIGLIKHDDPNTMWYTACKNTEKCKKKVSMESSGTYRCEACQESFTECERRYILSIRLHDSTGNLWAGAFDDVGVPLLGLKANDLHRMSSNEAERDQFENICFETTCKQFDLTVRAKMNEGPSGMKPRYTLSFCTPFNYKRATENYMREITEAFEIHQLV